MLLCLDSHLNNVFIDDVKSVGTDRRIDSEVRPLLPCDLSLKTFFSGSVRAFASSHFSFDQVKIGYSSLAIKSIMTYRYRGEDGTVMPRSIL